jgi:hypothetical protein
MAFDDFVRTELGRSSRRDSSSSSSVATTSKGEPKPFGYTFEPRAVKR